MNKIVLTSWDSGLSGAYSWFEDRKYKFCEEMPIYKKVLQEKLYQQDLKDGKKQIIKSGPNKGTVKMKVRRKEKTKNELNMIKILSIMKESDIVIIERQNPRPGNSASSSFTTGINYGKLLAAAELSGAQIHIVNPNVWKKDMRLSQDKQDSVKLAEKLTGKKFVTDRGRLLHDMAESALIGLWYLGEHTKGA